MALKRIIISFFISFLIFLHMILFFTGLFLIFKISVARDIDIINGFFVILVFLHKSVFYLRKYGFLRTKKSPAQKKNALSSRFKRQAPISHDRRGRTCGFIYDKKKRILSAGKMKNVQSYFIYGTKKAPHNTFYFRQKQPHAFIYTTKKAPVLIRGL